MSRKLIGKYQNYLASQNNQPSVFVESTPVPTTHSIIRRMLEQVKLISQIITYIWLYNNPGSPNEEKAKKLEYYFRHTVPDPNWVKEDSLGKKLFPRSRKPKILADLMGADLNEDTEEGRLLCAVFNPAPKKYKFPIFEKEAIENNFVSFAIDVSIFNGWITDPDENSPSMLHAVIAFPPRPQLSQATVTEGELEDWLKNRDDDHQFMADNPYIPTCTC